MFEPKRERWFYCCLCRDVSYKFECCNNTFCNGGGCEICKEHHQIIKELIEYKEYPYNLRKVDIEII